MTYSNSWYKKEYLLGLTGMGGGAGGILIGGGPIATSSDDGYQITKSLKFNTADTTSLEIQQPQYKGDTRRWTWAGWVKRGAVDSSAQSIFSAYTGANSNAGFINFYFHSHHLRISGWSTVYLETNAVFRDPSAWYHIVLQVDTTNSITADRMKFYVNGERITSFLTENQPSQNTELPINHAKRHGIGSNIYYTDTTHKFSGYLADVYFTDGLRSNPGAFGSFDSTGSFNPKAFAPPNPNDGRTWSSDTTNLTNPANAFDGSIGSGATKASTGSGQMSVTFDPPLTNVVEFEVNYQNSGVHVMAFNGGALEEDAGGGSTYGYWRKPPAGMKIPSTIDSFQARYNDSSTNSSIEMTGIRVNGVVLVDGQTDPTERNNPNDGRTWSDIVPTGDGFRSGKTASMGFDGDFTDYVALNNTTFTLPVGNWNISGKMEVMGGSNHQYAVNGGSAANMGANQTWTHVGDAGDITNLVLTRTDGAYPVIYGVRVDGHTLLDSVVDRSFNLNFSDSNNIGKNSFANSITGSSNGLPFYNTDSSGQTKESGYRADSSAGTTDGTGLVLAIPGDALTDEHNHVNTGSSEKTINTTNVILETSKSRFYGKSIHLNGKDAKITTTTDASDFDCSGGTFTFECWFMPRESTSTSKTIFCTKETGDNSHLALGINSNYLFCYTGSSQIMTTSNSAGVQMKNDHWHHIAVTRDGTTWRWFIDGTLLHSNSTGVSGSSDGGYFGYASTAGGSPSTRYIFSNYNDIRFYKGVCKWTAAFTVPTAPDWDTLNLNPGGDVNYSAGGSGGTNAGSGFDKMFDGLTSTYMNGSGSWSDTVTITFSPALTVQNSVEVNPGSHASQYKINSGSFTTITDDGGYHTLGFSGTLTTLTIKGDQSSNAAARCEGIKVDGAILVDSSAGDTFTDTPTNYGTDTGKGSEVRGNYATWNPLHESNVGKMLAKDGNLTSIQAANWGGGLMATMGAKTGKWYYELTAVDETDNRPVFGIVPVQYGAQLPGEGGANSVGYRATGVKRINTSGAGEAAYGDAWVDGDIIGVALDCDNGAVYFSRNGTWQASGDPTSGASRTNACHTWTGGSEHMIPAIAEEGSSTSTINFGQKAFKYTAPSGYKCLCTKNLSDTFSGDELNNPSKYFDTKLWTGTGASHGIDKVGFQPDLVWIKARDNADHHALFDAIRGATKKVYPSHQSAEVTDAQTLKSFDSDGFTVGTEGGVNLDTKKFVGWVWDAGTAAATPSAEGSLTPDNQWVNATAGFSITKYTGTQANATFGHGLDSAPDFMIHKMYDDGSTDWQAWHSAFNGTQSLQLSTNGAVFTQADMWNNTAPTDTVVHLGAGTGTNKSGKSIMMYLWTSIAGYSHFGSYSGNANADGPFIHLGFRPKMIIFKNSATTNGWRIMDTEVNTHNSVITGMYPNNSSVEDSAANWTVDYLSNGFKIRDNNNELNGSGNKIIYAAWAENPFKTARAV